MTGNKYMLRAMVAPIYRDTHDQMMFPVALAIKYEVTDPSAVGKSDTRAMKIPSPGPACGSHGHGGICGFTVDFIDLQSAGTNHGKNDIVELAQLAARRGEWGFEGIEELPMLVVESPQDIFGAGASLFNVSFLLLFAGSPLLLPCICLILKGQKVANPDLGESLSRTSNHASHAVRTSAVEIQPVGNLSEFASFPRVWTKGPSPRDPPVRNFSIHLIPEGNPLYFIPESPRTDQV